MGEREFDVCVIGSGPGGFGAAMRAWDHGLRVAIVERGALGGAGIHAGALSSKTWWELSRDYRKAHRDDRGYRADALAVDLGAVTDLVHDATDEAARQLGDQLRALASSHDADLPGRVTLIHGEARLRDRHTVHVGLADGGERELTAGEIVLATGSRPRKLRSVEVDGHYVMTSDEITSLRHFPESLVIVGAGVTGCEFATIFANFGRTRVFLIDRAPRILPYEDADIAEVCERNLEARGVTVHHGASLQSMRARDGGVEYTVAYTDGRCETHHVERALLSIGRVPNTERLGLEEVGVELDDAGYVVIHGETRTSVRNIHAVGDITRDVALVNIAEMEGRRAIDVMRGVATAPIVYRSVSSIMFLDPEVAAVGYNERGARAERISYRVATYGYRLVNRAMAMRATGGFVKILVTDDEEMRLLGMRALGVHASTMIEAVALAIQQRLSVRTIAQLVHPHPSVSEAVQDCCRMLLGESRMKPHVFTDDLRVVRVRFHDDQDAPEVTDLCRAGSPR